MRRFHRGVGGMQVDGLQLRKCLAMALRRTYTGSTSSSGAVTGRSLPAGLHTRFKSVNRAE
ncbi:hypothetical protein AOZ06_05180 [Kibdelosporangium phytohabitans]|uniref:Uncharacterized protein n=1 Tax=Kibdelosporangium phytohabitans TaxID=860235 RepID=A0A0N9HWD7_9PSEU|nr:hypothetical protein AOZ06_05180 [Kibdelosporangium phytohabitans]